MRGLGRAAKPPAPNPTKIPPSLPAQAGREGGRGMRGGKIGVSEVSTDYEPPQLYYYNLGIR